MRAEGAAARAASRSGSCRARSTTTTSASAHALGSRVKITSTNEVSGNALEIRERSIKSGTSATIRTTATYRGSGGRQEPRRVDGELGPTLARLDRELVHQRDRIGGGVAGG